MVYSVYTRFNYLRYKSFVYIFVASVHSVFYTFTACMIIKYNDNIDKDNL